MVYVVIKIFRGVPIEFLFLRRKDELFLLLLSSIDANTKLDQKFPLPACVALDQKQSARH